MKSTNQDIASDRGVVLLVDDDPLVLASLKATLKREGYKIIVAERGKDAVEIIKKESPAIIISDYNMPGMSGIEVMKEAIKLRPEAIRILLAGGDDLKIAISAINIGQIYQYISKPWNDEELKKILKISFDKYKLVSENKILQKLIFTQNKKLQIAHIGLQKELKIGARIHEKLLMDDVPKDIPGVVIDAVSLPSKEIDGDFFEFYRQSNSIFDLNIGDVMGKGLAAALVGTAIKTQIKYYALPFPRMFSFDNELRWQENSFAPSEILNYVHNSMHNKLKDLEYFVSLFYARFDLPGKILSYVDCGSTKPLHYISKEQKIYQLSGDSFPLGVADTASFNEKRVKFSEGDIFIFYSDGVTEARSESGEFFGLDRLISIVKKNNRLPASGLLNLIQSKVNEFTNKGKLDDDLTIVVIKIVYTDNEEKSFSSYQQFNCDISELESVRIFIRKLCQNVPGDKKRLSYEMQLVINEAFTNIVKHSRSGKNLTVIQLFGELRNDGLFIKISDRGECFNPKEMQAPCSLGERDTGYGSYIIQELADRLTYIPRESEDGWNHLSIFKKYHFGDKKMKFDFKKSNNVLIITLNEEYLDANHASEFKEKIMDVIYNQNAKEVVLDLKNLKFVDSSGLGSFLSVLRALNSKNGDLKLSRMNKPVKTLFELVKMHKIFEIFNTPEDAIRSFN